MLCVFAVILAITVISIYVLRDQVFSESEESLKGQITKNVRLVLSEAGEVFEERIQFGLQTLALPTSYSVLDAIRRGNSYSVAAKPSFTDSSATRYQLPARLHDPLTFDRRWPCDPTQPTDKNDLKGCTPFDAYVPSNKGKKLNMQRSSVFLKGLRYDGTNAQQLLNIHATYVDITQVMDAMVVGPFARIGDWQGAWVSTIPGGLFRWFPGQVGNLSSDANGVRIYDPVNRFWFQQWVGQHAIAEMTNLKQGKYSVKYSAPYRSLGGEGFLIAVSTPLHSQDSLRGVSGTDLRIASLAKMMRLIKFRDSGTAHLFHSSTGIVAASPQWYPSPGTTEVKTAGAIYLKAGSGGEVLGASCGEGIEERSGFAISRHAVLDGHYCMAAVVPLDEILQPIESQRHEINSTADELFVSCLIVILVSFFGFVAPCSCYIAYKISQPLIRTRKETRQIVANIGGDLLNGVNPDEKSGGIGEVQYLREGFLKMLQVLRQKRETPQIPPANPAWQQLSDVNTSGNATHHLGAVKVAPATSSVFVTPITTRPTEPRIWNRIGFRLVLQLILPMFFAMIVIIIYSGVVMSTKASDWVQPVRAKMEQEELGNLVIRANERAELVHEILKGYEGTLAMLKHYTEALYNGDLVHQSNYRTHFTPSHLCPAGSAFGSCDPPPLEYDIRVTDKWGEVTRQVNFDSSVWYAPGQIVAPAKRRWPDDKVYKYPGSMLAEHSGIATSLDNVARVAYFSSNVTYVAFGFENHEAYRQYPYQTYFTDPQQNFYCNDGLWGDTGSRIGFYTPLCRDWYTKPRANQDGEVVYGTIYLEIETKAPLLSLGRSLYHKSGKLIGVVDVGINIKVLEDMLLQTPLYESGTAYIFDKKGCAILHPYLDENKRREAECVDQAKLSAGSDSKFEEKYRKNILEPAARRENGTWSDLWFNEELDENERWFYVYMPIQDTPYQLILTAVDREIWKAAQDLEDDLSALTTRGIVITLVILVLFTIVLCFISFQLNRKLAIPLHDLGSMIASASELNYRNDVNANAKAMSSELIALLADFQKMLVALRFGNYAYHNGQKTKELRNLREAMQLVQETGNQRGIGVCQNNLANCIRGIPPKDRSRLLGDNKNEDCDPVKLMDLAVANARSLAATSEHPDVNQDTIGARLLGLSLAHLDAGSVKLATECIAQAIEVHRCTKKWQALARIAQVYAERPEITPRNVKATIHDSGERRRVISLDEDNGNESNAAKPVVGWPGSIGSEGLVSKVKEAARSALDIISAECGTAAKVEVTDAKALASLCLAMFILEGDASFLVWALNAIPNMDEAMVSKLGGLALSSGTISEPRLDAAISKSYPDWRRGPSKAKVMQFVLDASGSMAGGYLNTCKASISNILKNFTHDEDLVGFLAFAHYTQNVFTLTPKKGNEARMLSQVEAVETFGGTAFYDAVEEGIGLVNQAPGGMPKWLIALTDGADGHSKIDNKPPGRRGCEALRRSSVNIAIITVGDLPANTIQVVKSYCDAAQEAGQQGLHIVAHDTQKIAEAFETIASMMDEGLDEHL